MQQRSRSDAGIVTPVEMMYLLVFCLVAMVFLGFVGRLHAAGVQVTNMAQAAARAASMEPDSTAGKRAAASIVAGSPLAARCVGGPAVTTSWAMSPSGTWQGGSVTVRVACTVRAQSLAGLWVPGVHTVAMADTQPIDRYRR